MGGETIHFQTPRISCIHAPGQIVAHRSQRPEFGNTLNHCVLPTKSKTSSQNQDSLHTMIWFETEVSIPIFICIFWTKSKNDGSCFKTMPCVWPFMDPLVSSWHESPMANWFGVKRCFHCLIHPKLHLKIFCCHFKRYVIKSNKKGKERRPKPKSCAMRDWYTS